MVDGQGFDVAPEALRAVAGALRDAAGSVVSATVAFDEAMTPVRGAGGALASAVSELSTAIDRSADGARRDLEHLADSLQTTATAYRADDQRGTTSFGALLSRRLSP